MKKIIAYLFILLFSTSVFAAGFTGIFGIDFGKDSTFVKKAMSDKEWKLSDTDGTTLIYKKDKGTYANLLVDKIQLYFFNDKFYQASIFFTVNTTPDDVGDALTAIKETYSLIYQDDETMDYEGASILLWSFIDPNLNPFDITIMVYRSYSSCWFTLSDYSLLNDKRADDKKKEEEEKTKKNKSISSDL